MRIHNLVATLLPLVSATSPSLTSTANLRPVAASDLTAQQVALELGPQLSERSSIFGAQDERWAKATARYDPYMAPKFRMVVQPGEESDVAKIVQYANQNQIPVLAVSRKHGMTTSLGSFEGMQVDMSLLNGISIDPSGKTAWLQGGVYAKEVIDALWNAGHVTTTGSTACVGLLGPALGGGRGRLEGFHGVVSDNFVTLNLVLANGTSVVVSEETNPDLLWAMKGAGHNFGIVTSLEMKIHPSPAQSFYYKLFVWTQDKLETVFERANELHNNGSHAKEMMFNMGVYTIDPNISKDEAIIFWSFVYAGPQSEAEVLLAPFNDIPAASIEEGNVPYNKVADACGMGEDSWLCDYGLVHMHYSAGLRVWNVTAQRDIYELFNRKIKEQPVFSRSAVVMEDYSHEQVLAVDAKSSSYPWRDRTLLSFITVTYDPDPSLDDAARSFARQVRDMWNDGQPGVAPSTYVNYAHGDESVESMYGYEPWRLEKLRRLKAEYDPLGKFSYYNPITPAGAHGSESPHSAPARGQVVFEEL